SGKGSVQHLDALTREQPKIYGRLKQADGEWAARDDVWIKTERGHGGLTVGLGERSTEFGPALGFGQVVGDHFDNQVLIVRITQGPLALFKEGRPPSSGGPTGDYYLRLVNETADALKNLETYFPKYDGQGYEIAGFVWFQAWNDHVNPQASEEYADNLANLIRDLRKEWKTPRLPVIIGEFGQSGEIPAAKSRDRVLAFRGFQSAVAEMEEFRETTRFVRTSPHLRTEPAYAKPFLYYGNAETFYLIGDAFGKGMIDVLER
ncbi:MAG: sialate O-acetylesterase, partial [Planctomycetales bacterium]